jgi:transaldolase
VLTFSAAVKLFVESADPGEVLACVAAQRANGVATSASLLAEAAGRAGRAPNDLLREICAGAGGPVSVEVAPSDGDRDRMLREARSLAQVAGNVVVTLPSSDAGIEVMRACAAARIPTGVGACPSPERALVAARAGAAYVFAPLDRPAGADVGDGLRKLVALLRTFGLTTVVVAQVRTQADVVDAALTGVHAAAVPGALLRLLDAGADSPAGGRG